MERVLVIDDEEDIHYSFRRNYESAGWTLAFASSGEEGLRAIQREPPSAVVMDVRMAGLDGLETLTRIREAHPHLPVVLMTAHGTTQTAIEAMKRGAFDYLVKPFDVERMRMTIVSAFKTSRDMREKVSYQPLLRKEEYDEGIIGKTAAMQEVYKLIGQVSGSDAPVMITGETGTGKELVARAIVQHSPRAGRPFLTINCAAIPENLLESELFGHERGAFTGASERRVGKFEQCDGGTILLDEIGEMAASTQAKILRALQDGEVTRLGSNQPVRANVRFIASTHRDVERELGGKGFRRDLYYRLNVVRIRLPPLRGRMDDLPLLVDYFIERAARRGGRARRIAREALALLAAHSWPGNVRELQNAIERASVICRSHTIAARDIHIEAAGGAAPPPATPETARHGSALDAAMETLFDEASRDPQWRLLPGAERMLIARALEKTGGNQLQAAKMLGITRATLRKRIEKFRIRREVNVS